MPAVSPRSAFLLAALSAMSLAAFPLAARADGSIAHSRDGGNGLSYNYRGPRSADDAALGYCGSDSCRVVERYRHACAAIATSRGGGYGYAVREREGAAQRAAVGECEERNDRCRVLVSGCDD